MIDKDDKQLTYRDLFYCQGKRILILRSEFIEFLTQELEIYPELREEIILQRYNP